MSKNITQDVFDPVTPAPDDLPLTPEQEAELAAMEAGADWPRVSRALRANLDDAAELAKPDLARVSDAVFARLQGPAKAPEAPGLFATLFGLLARFQPHLALGAATAAIVLAVLPLTREGTEGTTTGPTSPTVAEVVVPEAPASVELRRIAFDNSEGVVFTDPATDSTVIWVREFDDA